MQHLQRQNWGSHDGDGMKKEAEFTHLESSHFFSSLAEEMLGPMGQATIHFHDLGRCSMNANSDSISLSG